MTAGRPTTAELVTAFARRFNATCLDRHGVGSPLGLWLLLALVAPAASGAERADLEGVLGTDAHDAAQRAAGLLDGPHPAVSSALAVWSDAPAVHGDGFAAWIASLPRRVQSGPVPSQGDADRWATTETDGLITSFPVRLDPRALLVLASALATRVTWTTPFDEASAADLGGTFGETVRSALASPADGEHDQFLARTRAAGLVGVLVSRSVDGLVVTSVVADESVAPADVHAAAHEVAAAAHHARYPGGSPRVSLFDVPLGPGHAWEVREVVEERFGSPTSEVVDAVLPSWSISSRHDLAGAPGVPAALDVLASFLDPSVPTAFESVQTALATFGKDGFEAAALSVMSIRATGVPRRTEVRERSATIRFNRPFAVVATAANGAPDAERPWAAADLGVPQWDGVPVFSAWVGSVS